MSTDLYPFACAYESARLHFIAAAGRHDGALTSHPHPLRGPGGCALSCDAVRIGAQAASRLLVCISGTHGVEGFAGSAAQIAWLERGIQPPRDTAVLLIHALNPWGFAHSTRTTENNVDLNRNFINFCTDRRPANPLYAELHAALCPPAWTPEHIEASTRALSRAQQRHGPDAVLDALNRGQYSHPDGLIYGGSAPEWSNTVLNRILAEHAHGARSGLVIDLHTGLGRFAEPAYLPFDPPGSDDRRWVESLFGVNGASADPFEGGKCPVYQGLACVAVAEALQGARTGKIVIEFGTLPMAEMLGAVQIDRLLRFAAPAAARIGELRKSVREAFNPDDQQWRNAVIRHSAIILERALRGLAQRRLA